MKKKSSFSFIVQINGVNAIVVALPFMAPVIQEQECMETKKYSVRKLQAEAWGFAGGALLQR